MSLLSCRWLILSICLTATPAMADLFYAPPAPEDNAPKFSGNAELGYTKLTGNSDTSTLLAKGNLTWLTGRYTHSVRAETHSVQDKENTTTEQYLVAARERYSFSDENYLFGFARWERDRFSGYQSQLSTIAGYGWQLIDTEKQTLSSEIGPGFRHDAYASGGSDNLAVLYAALEYEYRFSDDIAFNQELSTEATKENVTSRSLSMITSKLTSNLAMRASYDVKSNTHPPPDADAKTDTTTSLSIIYSW